MSTLEQNVGRTAFHGRGTSAAEHDVWVDHGVAIPMRDGALLLADIYRPTAPGRYPTLIERVGYERSARCAEAGDFFARRGYVFIGQSVRGIYGSEGEFAPFRDDGWGVHQDGYDTVEWAANQQRSSGAVGMLDGVLQRRHPICSGRYSTAPSRGTLRAGRPGESVSRLGLSRRRAPACSP
jgi:predicted acyl esterase